MCVYSRTLITVLGSASIVLLTSWLLYRESVDMYLWYIIFVSVVYVMGINKAVYIHIQEQKAFDEDCVAGRERDRRAGWIKSLLRGFFSPMYLFSK
jgi:hypothetical protein